MSFEPWLGTLSSDLPGCLKENLRRIQQAMSTTPVPGSSALAPRPTSSRDSKSGGSPTHNGMQGLQGGSQEERYHVTRAERDLIPTTAAEPLIAAGTTLQYWRGDKTWQALDTAAVVESTNLYFTNLRAQSAITGGASSIVTSNLTASRALASDASGKVAVATTTLAELNYVSGVTSGIQGQLNAKVASSLLGAANGVATLGADTKIPLAQIPVSLLGQVNFKGNWNASTNTPTLPATPTANGDYYIVTVAGATSLGGITDWKVGDWIIANGGVWGKVDNTDSVVTVNGYSGVVVLTKSDVGLSAVENTALSTWAGTANVTTVGDAAVLNKALTGYVVGANTALATTDTVLGAFKKVQGQINARASIAGQVFTGAISARSIANVAQANTPAATAYAWVLTSGNNLTLTLTSSTGDVTVTTSAPAASATSNITCVGHATLARNVSLTQAGVTWIYNGVATATTQLLGSIAATKRVTFRLFWASTTLCMISRVASDDAFAYPATVGGTGFSSYAVGDLLYASSTTALSKLASVAVGDVLRSGGVGVAPAWGKVELTTCVSGALPVANGGTGSATQNFVDLSSSQTVGGAKVYSDLGRYAQGLHVQTALYLQSPMRAYSSALSDWVDVVTPIGDSGKARFNIGAHVMHKSDVAGSLADVDVAGKSFIELQFYTSDIYVTYPILLADVSANKTSYIGQRIVITSNQTPGGSYWSPLRIYYKELNSGALTYTDFQLRSCKCMELIVRGDNLFQILLW